MGGGGLIEMFEDNWSLKGVKRVCFHGILVFENLSIAVVICEGDRWQYAFFAPY
jgi:hypothetical protein